MLSSLRSGLSSRQPLWRALPWSLGLFTVYLGLVLLLQWRNGAFTGEFGAYSDEAAHFVAGVMVQDYLREGLSRSPQQFAEEFYSRYPKVAVGYWPPAFYILQALWYWIFSPSRSSAMWLMACATALLAWLIASTLRNEFGLRAAVLAGALVVCWPVVQSVSASVMIEMPQAVVTTLALYLHGSYLEQPSNRRALAFGVTVALASLFKPLGGILLLMHVATVVIARAAKLLRAPHFWLPFIVVLCMAGPWYVWTFRTLQQSPVDLPWFSSRIHAELANALLRQLASLSPSVFALLLFGMALSWSRWTYLGRGRGIWISAAALLLVFWLFELVVPASRSARHSTFVTAAIAWYVTAGLRDLAQSRIFQAVHPRVGRTAIVLIVSLIAAAYLQRPVDTGPRGFQEVAAFLSSQCQSSGWHPIVLVSSDEFGEGALVCQFLLSREACPWTVVRASKLLTKSDWMGINYELRYRDPEQIRDQLARLPIQWVVLDEREGRRYPHEVLLRGAIQRDPATWRLIATGARRTARGRVAGRLLMFARTSPPATAQPLVLDLTDRIGKQLRVNP